MWQRYMEMRGKMQKKIILLFVFIMSTYTNELACLSAIVARKAQQGVARSMKRQSTCQANTHTLANARAHTYRYIKS